MLTMERYMFPSCFNGMKALCTFLVGGGGGSKTMTMNFQFVGLEGYLSYVIKLRLLS